MEADLQRFYRVDYRDRWRRDADGRRLLTSRRIGVLLRHLPPESSTAHIHRDMEPYWSVEAHLLDELRMAWVGTKQHPPKPHPQRPTGTNRTDPDRARKVAASQRRAAARQARIDAGEIT